MKVIILAGGSGTRLWPLSRKNFPKQFLKIKGDRSLLQQTTDRLSKMILPEDFIVMTNSDYKFHVKSDLNFLPLSHMILEPAGRNTAPAIALGIKYCLDRLGCGRDELIFVSPSDHIISPVEKFIEYVGYAEDAAKKGQIVTLGVRPSRPETGFGYIKVRTEKSELRSGNPEMKTDNSELRSGKYEYFHVERFTEKPDADTAAGYLKEGCYYWNSGMFAFSINTMLEEIKRHVPVIYEMLDMGYDDLISNFKQMPDISIDYAVAEKSDRVVTVPMDLYWNDIGSWDSLYDLLDKDEMGNVSIGDVITLDTKGSMIIGNKRLVTTIGLEECLIVETDDSILIAKKGETQKVREIVDGLKKKGRKESEEHLTTYRPWGNYTVLEEGPRYKIKRIVVNPNAKLSSQMHYHRSEHWIVVSGTAKVTIGDKEIFIHENESAYVPKSAVHRLENPGKVLLEMIEVQNGEYLGEDDIVRMEDIYGR
jgi:mannose-1-phosphate guanylyltransferase / mannose-6-phosphate isomerase